MSKLLVSILLVFLGLGVHAQPGGRMRGQGRERIHAAKMAYLTDRIHLTETQSGAFMPVYNEYEKEVKTLRQSYFKKYAGTNPADADDATSRQFIDDNLDFQQDLIGVKRRYNDRFLKVISPQQLTELNTAEREFRQILQKRLKERQGKQRNW